MSEKNNGGSMHPVLLSGQDAGSGAITSYRHESNWTVRDEFAARAMQSLILNPAPELLNGCGWEHVIAGAYQAADAMLAERAK